MKLISALLFWFWASLEEFEHHASFAHVLEENPRRHMLLRKSDISNVHFQVHQTTSSSPSVVDHLTLPSILYKCLHHFQKTMSVRFHLPPSSTIPLYPSLIVPGIPLEMVCSNQLLSGGNDEVEATDKWHQIQCRKGAC